jgi:hypothetical protein
VAALKLETHNDPRVVWCWGAMRGSGIAWWSKCYTAVLLDVGEEDVFRGEAR